MPVYLRFIIYMVCLVAASRSGAQPAGREPLAEVLPRLSQHFGVEIVCKRFAADTLFVRYAASRIRPYSLSESLDNLLHPLDLVWSGDRKITIQPFEYYRRTPADGKNLVAWLSSLCADRAAWEQRRATILSGVREALALDPFVRGLTATPTIILGTSHPHDGYSTQNYALETLPGVYVCGTIYAPLPPSLPGRNMGVNARHHHPQPLLPLILAPSGHWDGGRYRADQQYLLATLARMGAVAVDMDIFGWGESLMQVGSSAHTKTYAMQMQVLFSKRVADWLLASRRDIDTTRMGATGGSGGATHALLLAVIDPRFKVLAPVAHLVSHFDGGCPCESGRPVTLAAGGTCMPEILAAACAPRPVLVVSDGGDWTATYPTLELPFLQRIWGFYGAHEKIENRHFPDERHDYGVNKRRAVYEFFATNLRLDLTQADEQRVEMLPTEALQCFSGTLPANAVRSRDQLEQLIEKLK